MEFFPNTNKQSKSTKVKSIDRTLAKYLHSSLAKARLLVYKTLKQEAWANHFRLLREQFSKEEVASVLDWFVTHLNDKYTPKGICSAEKFRAKFLSIKAAMDREQESPEAQTKNLVISEDAKKIVVRCGGLHWPGEDKKNELAFIQLSLNNHFALRSKLWQFINQEKAKAALLLHERGHYRSTDDFWLRYAEAARTWLGQTAAAIQWWTHDVHRIAWTWKEWREGTLMKWAWSQTAKMFLERAEKWADQHYGLGKWQQLMERL